MINRNELKRGQEGERAELEDILRGEIDKIAEGAFWDFDKAEKDFETIWEQNLKEEVRRIIQKNV